MNPMKAIDILFVCPNCNQRFESDSLLPGADFTCTQCAFNFRLPHDAPTKQVTRPDPLPYSPIQTYGEKQVEKIFQSAASTNGAATAFFVLAGICLVLSVAIKFGDAPTDAFVILAAIGSGFFSLGLVFKIIAQLIYIRAEIKAKK
jgi:hypothetical protein